MYRKRLIASLVSIFTLGVVFGIYVFSDTFSFCAILVVAVLVSIICFAASTNANGIGMPKNVTAIALAVAVFSLGTLFVFVKNSSMRKFEQFDGVKSKVSVRIEELNENTIDARVVTCESGVPKRVLIRLYPDNYEANKYIPGDLLVAEVKYHYYDTVNYTSQGIDLVAQGSIIEHKEGNGILYFGRSSVYKYGDELFGDFESAEGISKGITIGDRSSIDSYIFSLYRSAGLSHVLAISGLHISIIGMALYNFLRRLNINNWVCSIAAVTFATFYSALVGFNAGSVRAVIMLSFVVISKLFMRKSDGFTSISIALFVLIIFNPYSICSAGFQLSFLCCLGILLIEPYMISMQFFFINQRGRLKEKLNMVSRILLAICEPLLISMISSIFSFPVILMRFDSVSYVSPLINIVCVPIFTVGVELSLIAHIVAPFSLAIAKVIAYPAGICFDFVTDAARLIYDYDIGIISSHIKLMWIPFVISLAMILCLIFLKKRRFSGFIVCLLSFCMSLVLCDVVNCIEQSNTTVIEYGSGKSEYVYTSSNGGVYVDLGGYISSPETIFENGETLLSYYIVPNYDNYTYKKLNSMINTIKTEKIVLPRPIDKYDMFIFSQIKELANNRNCDILYFEEDFYDLSYVGVCGFNSDNEGTLVCVDVNGRKIRILGDGFSNAVNCDIAIITHGYIGNRDKIYSDEKYACKAYLEECGINYYNCFDDRIRVEIDSKEREYKIYEP